MNPHIFREYDIRGVVGSDLTSDTVRTIARSIATFLRSNNAQSIAVGFDARESSPAFCEIVTGELSNTGCDAILLGMVPTPVLYHTVYTQPVDGAIMITGSHNPADHNGFKICLGTETLYGRRIQEISKIAMAGDFPFRGKGIVTEKEVLRGYQDDLVSRTGIGGRKLKVVVDAGNGMGGVTSVPVYRDLGVEVIELFTEPDSTFPNHLPDPAVPENLLDLIEMVKMTGSDLGIAFDGDADRITAVDETGKVLWGDELTALFAREILQDNPGSAVIGEVKCSQILFDEVERLGGNAIMCKAGHSIVKSKMKETGAILAGEMSGHIFFSDRYYGFDDACYAGARLLELLSKTDKSLSELRAGLPQAFSSPEIRIPCPEEMKSTIVNNIAIEFSGTYPVSTIDGARIKFENGWGLVRPSNTQAILVLRFEAESEKNLAEIRKTVERTVMEFLNKLR